MRLTVIPSGQLNTWQRTDIVWLCSVAFDVDYGPFLKEFGPATHVLCHIGGYLVSHALWVTRWLQPGALPPLRTAYVEGVATNPAFRGEGYGTAVMVMLAHKIQDFELGGLATGSFGFYARLGWERWWGPTFERTEDGLLPAPTDGLMILRLPLTPPLDTDWPLSCEWRAGDIW